MASSGPGVDGRRFCSAASPYVAEWIEWDITCIEPGGDLLGRIGARLFEGFAEAGHRRDLRAGDIKSAGFSAAKTASIFVASGRNKFLVLLCLPFHSCINS